MTVKATYDEDVDALYLEVVPEPPDGVVETANGVCLDVSAAGEIVGIEVLRASRGLNMGRLLPARGGARVKLGGKGEVGERTIRYDGDVDALTIALDSDGAVDNSEEIAPGVIVDYDANGSAVAIEVLDASKRFTPHANATAAERRVPGQSPRCVDGQQLVGSSARSRARHGRLEVGT